MFQRQWFILTRIEHFNAAHKLFNPAWSRDKNEEVFGKCANENWAWTQLAAQTYRSGTANDFWPGPLDPVNGTIDVETCFKWDKHFKVLGSNIASHLANYNKAVQAGVAYDCNTIPEDVLGWPARGNPYFADIHGFELPNTTQGLAAVFDQNRNGRYNPCDGDYPVIEIRGCNAPQYPDEMIFWIYNNAGGIHTQTQGKPIQMEIQVQSFAYATNDEINDMTFQRYKLINRATTTIDSTFFAMWVDPDLGCFTDDYIGCDTSRSLAYVYNEDATDGETGCACPGGVNTYCNEVPILGVDYFRGPLDENGLEIGMSSFTYYNNQAVGNWPNGMTDPQVAQGILQLFIRQLEGRNSIFLWRNRLSTGRPKH